MALNNLWSLNFTETELTQIDQAISSLETVLQGKTVHLTPEQRQQYGRIAEQNKLFVNKAKGYMEQYPHFVPPFLDKEEFDRDHAARTQVESRIQRLASLSEQLSDTKVLLDHDNYHNAITFYRNVRYLAGENSPGTTSVYQDMQQFFKNPTTGVIQEPINKNQES